MNTIILSLITVLFLSGCNFSNGITEYSTFRGKLYDNDGNQSLEMLVDKSIIGDYYTQDGTPFLFLRELEDGFYDLYFYDGTPKSFNGIAFFRYGTNLGARSNTNPRVDFILTISHVRNNKYILIIKAIHPDAKPFTYEMYKAVMMGQQT